MQIIKTKLLSLTNKKIFFSKELKSTFFFFNFLKSKFNDREFLK